MEGLCIKKRYVLLFLLVIVFLLIVYLININNSIDIMFNNIIRDITDSKTCFFKFITFLGGGIFLILLTTILFIIIKDKSIKVSIVLNLFISFLISNFLLKMIFKRERPMDMIISESGYSFPSCHAFVAVSFYGLLIYYIWKSNLSRMVKFVIAFLLTIIIILIGVSRVYLGVHYPTDVLGGFVGGIIYLIVFLEVFYRVKGVCYEKEKR